MRFRFTLIAALLLLSAQVEAAVSLVGTPASGRRTGSSTNTLTISATVPSGTDYMLIAICTQTTATPSFTSVVYNTSENATVYTNHQTTGGILWWILRNPTATTANVVITPAVNMSVAATIWYIDGWAGWRAWDTERNAGVGATDFTINAVNQNTGIIFDASCSDGNNQVFTAVGSQTTDTDQSSNADTSAKMHAGHIAATGSSQSMGTTWSVSDIGTSAVLGVMGLEDVPSGAPSMFGPVSYGYLTAVGQTLTWQHQVRPQDNELYIVCISSNADTTVSSVTYNGDALTETVESNLTSINHLTTPDVGTFDVVVTMSGSSRIPGCIAASLRSDGIRNTVTRNSSAETVNLTTVANDIAIDLIRASGTISSLATFAAGANQTSLGTINQIYNEQTGSPSMAGSYETASGTTTTMSWTITSDPTGSQQGVAGWKPSTVPYNAFTAQRLIKDADDKYKY